jgi:hypothetical protein
MTMRLQCIIPATSAIPADYATNTWHFDDGGDPLSDFMDELKVFYNSIRPYYPATVAQNSWEFKVYDLDDPEPRAPVADVFWNLTSAPTGYPLPSECAMVLSYQADKVSGLPQARRRGRVYLGPLNTTTLESSTARPAASVVTALAAAGGVLLAASGASGGWKWTTYSTVTGTGFEVLDGWVDNAYDTQRRRGISPTSRTLF